MAAEEHTLLSDEPYIKITYSERVCDRFMGKISLEKSNGYISDSENSGKFYFRFYVKMTLNYPYKRKQKNKKSVMWVYIIMRYQL